MRTKRILSLLVALVMIFATMAITVSAAGEAVAVSNKEVSVGEAFSVDVLLTGNVSMVGLDITYDAEKLSYTGIEGFGGFVATETETGRVRIERQDTSSFVGDNSTIATVAFTACDAEALGDAGYVESAVNVAIVSVDYGDFFEDYFYNGIDGGVIEGVTLTNGVVTIKKVHAEPTFEVAIAGEAKNGVELEATVSNFVDNLGLTPVYTYQWSVDGVAVADATTSKFALTAAEIGKVVSVAVTATVEAEVAPSATVEAATEAVAIDPTMLPVVSNVAFDKETVKVGSAVVVTYDYEDGNALDDASVITFVKADAADAEEWVEAVADTDYTVDEDGKVKFTKEVKGMFVKISVLATNAEGIAAVEATLSETAYEIKNKSTSGSGSMSGPNLAKPAVKPETPVEPETPVDPSTPVEPEVPAVDPIKNAPADKLVLAIGNANVSVFGEVVANDVAPIIVADRTMLPARIVAESLGAEVAWDAEARVVTITKGEVTIVLTIDSNKALVNGAEVELDSAAFIANDRTYTPVRFIAEALAATVEWDAATQAVTITPAK